MAQYVPNKRKEAERVWGVSEKVSTDAPAGDLRKENRTKAENKMNPDTERLELCEAFNPVCQVSSTSEEPLSVIPQSFCTCYSFFCSSHPSLLHNLQFSAWVLFPRRRNL